MSYIGFDSLSNAIATKPERFEIRPRAMAFGVYPSLAAASITILRFFSLILAVGLNALDTVD